MQDRGSVGRKVLLCVGALVPVLVLYGALIQQAQSVPMHDDYPAIFSFGLQFMMQPTWLRKLIWIFEYQYGDYKLIVENTLVALDLAMSHRFHFGFLIWCGNLLPVGIGWLMWKMYAPGEKDVWRKLTLYLPLLYLLAQLSYVENFDWAMCGLQTFPVVLFSLAALWLLLDRGEIAGGCLCAVLATFSSANGFLLAPLGVIALWGRWRALVSWTACFVAALAVYLYHYFPIPQLPARPLHQLVFFLSFLGGAAENQHRWPVKHLATVLGVLMLGVFVLAWRKRFYRTHPAAFFSAVWILLTAGVVTRGRASFPTNVALTMRYRIYSDLLLCFCYGVLAAIVNTHVRSQRARTALYGVTLGLAIAFCAVSDLGGYRFLTARRIRVAAELRAYEADNTKAPYVNLVWGNRPYYFWMNSATLLNQVRRQNLYEIPPLPTAR